MLMSPFYAILSMHIYFTSLFLGTLSWLVEYRLSSFYLGFKIQMCKRTFGWLRAGGSKTLYYNNMLMSPYYVIFSTHFTSLFLGTLSWLVEYLLSSFYLGFKIQMFKRTFGWLRAGGSKPLTVKIFAFGSGQHLQNFPWTSFNLFVEWHHHLLWPTGCFVKNPDERASEAGSAAVLSGNVLPFVHVELLCSLPKGKEESVQIF